MAKKLKDEDLVLNIIVNGDKGRSEMNQLNRAISDTKLQLSSLEIERKKLIATGKQNTIEWHANEKAINQANSAISQAEERLKILRNGMKLTDMSIRDLTREQQRLTALMKSSVPGSKNWMRYKDDLKQVQNRLSELSGEAHRAGISLSKTADKFNRYAGVVTAFAGTVAVGVLGLRKASLAYAEYDDKLADVEKTTGLTKEQVIELSESLANVDTRTAQLELLDLGRQAGKLGITAKEDVEAFVVAADKIGVALGEDLGGKEEAINKMGKLVDLFKIKDEYGMADGMLKVGSAVNALGAASTANEGYIVEFTSRVGGIALSSNISAANVMGLAATFDSLNAQSEASSTVINKIVVGMFKNTSEYAKVAGMDVQSFKDLLAFDTNEALLRVLGGFKGADLGVTANLLGEVGENGARAAQAVSLISENIHTVREQQAIANEEFVKGTGVVEEFNKKNITEQAILEKAQKRAQQRLVELGETIKPLMRGAVSGFSLVIQGLTASVKYFIEYKAVIIGITVATLTLVAAQKIKNNWDKITVTWGKLKVFWSNANTVAILRETASLNGNTAATATYTTSQKGLVAIKALLVGQFKAAGIAAKSFFASIGPVGWIITGLTLLGGALGYVSTRSEKATASQQALNDINRQAVDSVSRERVELERLLAVANDKNESDRRRKFAITELQRLMPNGIALISQETVATGKAKEAIDDYCKSLQKRAIIEAAKEKLQEVARKKIENDTNDTSAELSFWQSVGVSLASRSSQQAANSLSEQFRAKNKAKFKADIDEYEAQLLKIINTAESEIINQQDGATNQDVVCKKCGNNPCTCYQRASEDKKKWTLENDEKFNRERIALKLKLFKGEYATEEEYNKKLLELEIATLEERIALNIEKGVDLSNIQQDLLNKRYTQQKTEQDRLKKLHDIIDGDKSPQEKELARHEKQLVDLGLFGLKRENMTKQQLDALLILEKTHTKNLSSIHYDNLASKFDEAQRSLKADLLLLKRAQGVELAEIKTFADKKNLLRKYYSTEELRQITNVKDADRAIKAVFQKQEIEIQEKHLRNMLNVYQHMMEEFRSKGSVFGQVLTSDDAKKLEELISQLEEKLANIGVNIKFTPEKGNGVDVFGMTPKDWLTTFQNLKKGEAGLDDWGKAIGAVGQAMASTFSEVSNLMTSIEQREFAKHEKKVKEEKKLLDKKLNAGVISQETYNRKIQMLDDETEAKRIEMERKQAERQKAMAIFQVLLNTAMAIMSTSAQLGWPAAIPFVAAVSALGAIQIATILAQPLPGAEDGGWMVERSQDGKRFNAQYDPTKRGRIDEPTVIVGENGSEYVVPADGYANPTIRPILDTIELARKNGTLRNINLNKIQSISGRERGGNISTGATSSDVVKKVVDNSENNEVMKRVITILEKLDKQLEEPIEAYITMGGSRGLAEKTKEYNRQKNKGYM